MSAQGATIVVGVEPGQKTAVLHQAALFARHFGARLVFAYADAGRYVVEERADGTIVSLPIDPDLAEGPPEGFDPRLHETIATELTHAGIRWDTRYVVGNPADALSHLADRLDAVMIIVGSRESGLRGTVREFFNGSIAARLVHRQRRPVVVVPLSPVARDSELPWTIEE